MPGGGAKDGDVLILTRDDLIAAFQEWMSEYRLEPETREEALRRISPAGATDYATACADQLIDCLIASAADPMSDI
jgi:hypothetical protein